MRKRTREKGKRRRVKKQKSFFYREFHYAIDGSVEHESYSLIDPSPLSVSRSKEKRIETRFGTGSSLSSTSNT